MPSTRTGDSDIGSDTLLPSSSYRESVAPIPSSLVRVPIVRGLHKWKASEIAILPTKTTEADFLHWWTQTSWHDTNPDHGFEWFSRRRSHEIWSHMQSVARSTTGEPFARCIHCHELFRHPRVNNNGNSAIKRHIEKGYCRKGKTKGNTVLAFSRNKPVTFVSITVG